jgi:hypothetical protein
MATLGDFDLSIRMREAISAIATSAVLEAYPRPRYGTVTAVNHAAGKVTIHYPDDSTDVVLSSTVVAPEVGAVVRVAGQGGARFIDEIQSGTARVRTALNVTGALSAGAGTLSSLTSNGQIALPLGGNSLALATDGSYISWYNAGYVNRRGYLQGNTGGVILSSEAGVLTLAGVGGINLSGGRVDFGGQPITGTNYVINGYTMDTAANGTTIACRTSLGYINAVYFNSPADVNGTAMAYVAGMNGDNYLRWYTYVSVNQVTGSSAGGAWQNSAIRSIPANTTASVCFHNGNYAPVIGSTIATGNNLYFRDGAFGANTSTCVAAAFAADSSERYKKNITDWPLRSAGAAVERATDLLVKLRTVTFQNRLSLTDTGGKRRSLALIRLNRYRENRGLEQFDYKMPEHDCDVHECDGTAGDPCVPKLMADRERFGFIAEEVYQVFPTITPLDADKIPEAVDLGQMLAVVVAATQELIERVKTLEGAA